MTLFKQTFQKVSYREKHNVVQVPRCEHIRQPQPSQRTYVKKCQRVATHQYTPLIYFGCNDVFFKNGIFEYAVNRRPGRDLVRSGN